MTILIKNASFKEEKTDILIRDNKIEKIAPKIEEKTDKTIDASHMAVAPGFINMHTHSPMTLFRGYADDMELERWLNEKIWPYEAKLTDEMVYWGSKLACLEMIKTGTTCFNDMYMHLNPILQATEEMGLRAFLSTVIMDPTFRQTPAESLAQIEKDLSLQPNCSDLIQLTLAPHAVYTVSEEILRMVADYAKEHKLFIHMHANETEKEVANCVQEHGYSPIHWLDKIGFLGPNVILAHCLWLSDTEINILAEKEVKVVHNPNSNLKLASGYRFKFKELKEKGVCVGLGTDGDSSSNNLDMIDAMKTASLIGKVWRKDPTANTAKEMFHCATMNGGRILNLPIGKIKEGNLADLILIDLNNTAFTPNFHFTSNMVYAANGYCVDTVICNGKILMENKQVEGEETILQKANEMANKLFA